MHKSLGYLERDDSKEQSRKIIYSRSVISNIKRSADCRLLLNRKKSISHNVSKSNAQAAKDQ